MNNQNDNGSLKQVALPAEGGCKGGSDSRSETLSPREWPTLEAALHNCRMAYCELLTEYEWDAAYAVLKADKRLSYALKILRRGRPRGESRVLSNSGSDKS